jgi:DNA polymerase III subunit delta'
VLVAAATHRVAPTLVSRCQRVRFLPLSAETVLSIIGRQVEADPVTQRAAAALSGGSAQRGLQLLEGDHLTDIQETMQTLLRATEQGSMVELFTAASEVGRDRLKLIEMLDHLRIWSRDLLLIVEGLDTGATIHSDHLQRLRAEAGALRYRTLLHRLRALDEAQTALRGNVHPALALENLVLHFRQVSP